MNTNQSAKTKKSGDNNIHLNPIKIQNQIMCVCGAYTYATPQVS